MSVYTASPIKRQRATKADMVARAEFLIEYARAHHPVTVRQLYYQAEVHGLPGIEKTDAGYNKIQYQVLQLRREGLLDYGWISDATRWMRKPMSYDSIRQALEDTARFYRKSLWQDADQYVEIWCEKDALAGVMLPVTEKYDVPLMVTRGFSSETFCYEAVAQRRNDWRDYVVYYLGDFDRAGRDAAQALREKLHRFSTEFGVAVEFNQIGVSVDQVMKWSLPTRPHKRKSPADKSWPFPFACELDAIPPDNLRGLVEDAINRHLPQDQLRVLQVAEASEREQLRMFAKGAA